MTLLKLLSILLSFNMAIEIDQKALESGKLPNVGNATTLDSGGLIDSKPIDLAANAIAESFPSSIDKPLKGENIDNKICKILRKRIITIDSQPTSQKEIISTEYSEFGSEGCQDEDDGEYISFDDDITNASTILEIIRAASLIRKKETAATQVNAMRDKDREKCTSCNKYIAELEALTMQNRKAEVIFVEQLTHLPGEPYVIGVSIGNSAYSIDYTFIKEKLTPTKIGILIQ